MISLNEKELHFIKLQKTYLQNVSFKEIETTFYEGLQQDYEIIKPYLPEKVNAFIDIGCGIGGVNYHISNHYNHQPEVHLLDKSGVSDDIGYGYKQYASFYCSLPMARSFLKRMGVPKDHIFTHDMLTGEYPANKVDLVVSFISWGFHYPIYEYFAQVNKSLNSGGVVITDVRKGIEEQNPYDGFNLLKSIGKSQIIFDNDRYYKVLVQKK
jgi:hypothetical protein